MGLISCPACGKQVSQQAASCPHCGHPIEAAAQRDVPRRSRGRVGAALVAAALIGGVIAAASKPDEDALIKAIQDKHGLRFVIGAVVGEAIGTAKYSYHDYVLFSTLT